MRLIDVAVKEKHLEEYRIRRSWCPITVGYKDIVKCEEDKYDCHNRSCWDIEVEGITVEGE